MVEFTSFGSWSRSLTQLSATNVTINGAGVPPLPLVIDPTLVADFEAYEGVLVTVEAVDVSSAPDGFGEFGIQGDLFVDDLFVIFSGSATVGPGDTFTSITGILHDTWDNYKLEPREEDEFVGWVDAP